MCGCVCIYIYGLPCGLAGKESPCSVGDLGLITGLGRYPGEGKGYLLQCSGLENSMDHIVHGVAKSWTQLSDFHFTSLHIYIYIYIYMYTYIYIFIQWNTTQSSKKNEIMSFAVTGKNLEIIILSEVSQRGKNKYHMISLICGI